MFPDKTWTKMPIWNSSNYFWNFIYLETLHFIFLLLRLVLSLLRKFDFAQRFTQQTAVRTQFFVKTKSVKLWFLRFSLDLLTFFKRMASTSNAKHAKYDSAVDDLISSVRRSFFGKTADEEFFTNLKFMIEGKITLYTSGI